MAYPVGANVAAIVKGKIIRRFAAENAFNEGTAKTLEELDLENKHKRMMNYLIRRGRIIKTNDQKYYLSQDYYEQRQKRKKILIPICLFLCVVIVILCLRFSF